MLPLFTDCAERAERLRRDGAEVVLVTGCELSVFARGYLPGDTLNERIPVLAGPGREAALRGIPDKVNSFLREVDDAVRPLFGGRVSYASCPLDGVDWAPFDIVGLDAFRSLRNAATYRTDLRKECGHGKPVAIMEAGCCTYRGAESTAAPAGTWRGRPTASPSNPAWCATRASRSATSTIS